MPKSQGLIALFFIFFYLFPIARQPSVYAGWHGPCCPEARQPAHRAASRSIGILILFNTYSRRVDAKIKPAGDSTVNDIIVNTSSMFNNFL